jgi:L-fuculose-phosphate aldolase
MSTESSLRERLVRIAARLDAKGILTATDGNLSVRLEGDALLITPSGSCKGLLRSSDIVLVDAEGKPHGGTPSVETALHRAIYAARPDVGAVVHAHPPFATAYAVAGIALDRPILSEAVLALGEVPVAPYSLPSQEGLARAVAGDVDGRSAVLMRHHGAVTFARDIESAGLLMETLEHVASIDFRVRMLGSEAVLTGEQVEELRRLRATLSGSGRS